MSRSALLLPSSSDDFSSVRYRAAFLACRRHRIDLNILYDRSPALFRSHLDDFVSQIKQVDHLNLFLSGLKNEDVTATMYRPLVAANGKPACVLISQPARLPSLNPRDLPLTSARFCRSTAYKINEVCDMVRGELEKRDVFHYANTILTAYVRKSPPEYESALGVLVELKGKPCSGPRTLLCSPSPKLETRHARRTPSNTSSSSAMPTSSSTSHWGCTTSLSSC